MEENQFETIEGKVSHIIYHNDETFFTVLRFQLYDLDEKNIIATGIIPSLEKDTLYTLQGHYTEHPKYGMQFQVASYRKKLPNDRDNIVRYLSGPRFVGIGNKMAGAIVDEIGFECLQIIKEDPDVLDRVKGINPKKKQAIIDGLATSDDELERTIQFFTVNGIGIRNILRINKVYGDKAVEIISENPYRVIEDCDGFGFKTADKIAKRLGFPDDFPARIEAYLTSLVMDMCMQNGDSYVDVNELEERFMGSTSDIQVDFSDALMQCITDRRLIQEETRIYPTTQYDAEENIANFLSLFPYNKLEGYDQNDPRIQAAFNEIQTKLNINYDEKQIEAINTFINNDLMILTGGPGTGKTTVVRGMVSLFKNLYPNQPIACCAPTGRAAKRLAELTETPAYTIHSLLRWDLESNTFGVNQDNPLMIDLLIIDEFSMVDNWLFYNLLLACENVKKICIIGDEDQLPSVSPGCVLKDLIDSKICPVIRLDHIFRQKDGSDIIKLAHQISKGQVDLDELTNDFKFIECDSYQVKDTVIKIVQNAIEKGYEINDVQVLACMYNGVAGIDRLNNALQECFNPPRRDARELKVGYRTYREQDKILQLKNQPDDDVYNGDIGTLLDVIYAKEDVNNQDRLVVDFGNVFVEYTSYNFNNLSHAYCISVHKSQGSEYPIVIMPIVKDFNIMLQRRLVYTAVTRAKKSLILVGDKKCFYKAIDTLDLHVRKSTLVKRIKDKRLFYKGINENE